MASATDLTTRLGPLTLRNPVLAAAGTFGYGEEFAEHVPLERLGAVVTKTLTLAPRDGNAPPRLVETPAGMLNAVGLSNMGIERFLVERWPRLRTRNVPVVISILGDTREEFLELARRVEAAGGAAALELNLSCPNVGSSTARSGPTLSGVEGVGVVGHELVAQDPAATEAIVAAVRKAVKLPLIAKLAPDVSDIRPIAQAAERGGADILTVANTFLGLAIDAQTRRSRLGRPMGGLSGPAIKPLALYRVWRAAQAVRIPIIGLGGIRTGEDAAEFLLAGARAVAVGTAHFADPRASLRVVEELARLARRQGLARIEEWVGAYATG